MKIKLVTKKEEWNITTKRFASNTFLNSWTWGEFSRNTGEKFYNYGLYKKNKLIGLIPLQVVRGRRGSYLNLRHAPCIDWNDQQQVTIMQSFLEKQANIENVSFIRISPLLKDNNTNRQILQNLGYKKAPSHDVDAERTIIIDLIPSEKDILAQMRKTTRHSIKKAQKLGVTTKFTTNLSYFDEFWSIFTNAVQRNKWTAYSYEYVKAEWEIMSKIKMAFMVRAIFKNKCIASSIFFVFNKQVFYNHSGSLTKYRHIPASHFLQWKTMLHSKKLGAKKYNLWGVSPASELDHPWHGLSLFKRGFGGVEQVSVHAHDYIVHPWAYATRLYEWLESKKKGY